MLRALHGIPHRIFFRNLEARQRRETVIREVRREISTKCLQRAEVLKAAEVNGQDDATEA